jgi:flagellar protein FliS
MSPHSQSAYQTNQFGSMSAPKLVLALLDAALTATTRASIALEDGNIPARGEAVSRAMAIVGELQGCLDLEAGDVATNLFALYDYATRELLAGNLRADATCFANVEKVLTEIHDGWSAMIDAVGALGTDEQPTEIAEYA